MEDCNFCSLEAVYQCVPCKVMLCEEHKSQHEQVKKKIHLFEKLGTDLTPEEIEKILTNLSLKINHADECTKRIIEETRSLINEINHSYLQALATINIKSQYYYKLVDIARRKLTYSEKKTLQQELKSVPVPHDPTNKYLEIQLSYSLDFLNTYNLPEYPKPNPQPILTEPVPKIPSSTDKKNNPPPNRLQQESSVLEGHTSQVYSVAVTHDSRHIISGSADLTIRIWSLLDKKHEFSLEGHSAAVLCVAVTPDDKYIVSGSADNTLIMWDFQKKKKEATLIHHTNSVFCLAITRDNRFIVSGSGDNTLVLWDIKKKTKIGAFTGHSSRVSSLVITMDNGFIVSGSADTTIRLWNLQQKRFDIALQGHTLAVSSLAVTSDNLHIVSGSFDWTIKIWSILRKVEMLTIKGNASSVNCIAINSGCRYLVYGLGNQHEKDHKLRIWNLMEGRQETVLTDHRDTVFSVALTNDNQYIISGSKDNTIRIWTIPGINKQSTGALPLDFEAHKAGESPLSKRESRIHRRNSLY